MAPHGTCTFSTGLCFNPKLSLQPWRSAALFSVTFIFHRQQEWLECNHQLVCRWRSASWNVSTSAGAAMTGWPHTSLNPELNSIKSHMQPVIFPTASYRVCLARPRGLESLAKYSLHFISAGSLRQIWIWKKWTCNLTWAEGVLRCLFVQPLHPSWLHWNKLKIFNFIRKMSLSCAEAPGAGTAQPWHLQATDEKGRSSGLMATGSFKKKIYVS